MEKKTKNIINDEVKKKTYDAIDNLGDSIKKASREIFDVIVERTAEIYSDIFDSTKDKLKGKISERGKDDRKNKTLSDKS